MSANAHLRRLPCTGRRWKGSGLAANVAGCQNDASSVSATAGSAPAVGGTGRLCLSSVCTGSLGHQWVFQLSENTHPALLARMASHSDLPCDTAQPEPAAIATQVHQGVVGTNDSRARRGCVCLRGARLGRASVLMAQRAGKRIIAKHPIMTMNSTQPSPQNTTSDVVIAAVKQAKPPNALTTAAMRSFLPIGLSRGQVGMPSVYPVRIELTSRRAEATHLTSAVV
jgi:hypothetical protein